MAHVSPRMLDHARAMRKEPTPSEARLWSWLRDRRFGNYKFRRQVPIAGYILDFYCAELKLAIEVDGPHHATDWMSEYDGTRTMRLRARGIEVLRLSNELFVRDSRLAAECIQAAVERIAKG